MDDDLAFCLGRFIDDQVQIIDDRLEEIKKEEFTICRKIAQEKLDHHAKKPAPKSKGVHQNDHALVDRFIRELREAAQTKNTRTVIDDQTCIDTLRAETSTKVNASAKYLTRLKNLARPMPNNVSFVQACTDAIDYFQSPQEFDNNFKGLMTVLERAEANDVLGNIQSWWTNAYGSRISELNRRNERFNKAVTEKGFVAVSQTSRIVDNSRKLIAARTIIIVQPPTREIIRRFVQQLLSLDEEKRETINEEELVNQLHGGDIEEAIQYAQRWVAKRDEVRNQKEETDPYDVQMEEATADYGRRRIAQEAKKLALAALLCRLAVGSTNGDQFDQQLKKTVNAQKDKNQDSLPVISGEIRQPEVEELPMMIQLDMKNTDMERWIANRDGIREKFGVDLCRAFGIPDQNIRIANVERDKGVLHLCIAPPYGKNVIDSLNGSAPDALVRMQAVRKCCNDIRANVESITLGEFGLQIEDRLMDPQWNRIYVWPSSDPSEGEYWLAPIIQGGKPYYCPSGWKRFGIKVAEDDKEFDAHWGTWQTAYHGTAGKNASKILTSGLKVSTQGCFYDDGVPRVHVSPSIEYSGHPRYARPWKRTKRNGQDCWYQLVFQCRVNPASVDRIGPETLIHDEYKQTVIIDSNFDNSELEWIVLGKDNEQFITEDIICYGLMMRISDVDPKNLTPSAWWKHSLHADSYAD